MAPPWRRKVEVGCLFEVYESMVPDSRPLCRKLFWPLLVLMLAGCSAMTPRQLEGVWVAHDGQGHSTTLIFGPGARFQAVAADGSHLDGVYWENFKESPAQLDIKLEDGQQVATVMRVDGKTLELQGIEPGKGRPRRLDQHAIVFSRVSEDPTEVPSPAVRKSPK